MHEPWTPKEHQAQTREISRERPSQLYGHKPGTGKTYGQALIHMDRPMPTLIVAQKSIIPTSWEKCAAACGIPITTILEMPRAKRLKTIADWSRRGDETEWLAMNYEPFRAHAKDLIAAGVRRIVFDESSKLKNRDASTTKAAIWCGDRVDEVNLLSGTPAPNCPTDLWSQLRVLSPDAAGRTFYAWAYKWFDPQRAFVRGKWVITGWRHKAGMREAFYESIRPWVWFLAKEDCIDLPAKMTLVRMVTLSRDERKIYDDMLDDFRADVGGDVMRIRAEAQPMKLRQITGGSVKDTTTGRTIEIGSSKLNELLAMIEEIGDQPVLVWAQFRSDCRRIAMMLKDHGRRVAAVYGESDTRAADAVAGMLSRKLDTIVAHPASMGHGTDGLQGVCGDAIFFGLDYSAENHEQAQDRIHRMGMDRATYHYLVAADTIDEGLLRCVLNKGTRQEALLNELKRKRRTKRET